MGGKANHLLFLFLGIPVTIQTKKKKKKKKSHGNKSRLFLSRYQEMETVRFGWFPHQLSLNYKALVGPLIVTTMCCQHCARTTATTTCYWLIVVVVVVACLFMNYNDFFFFFFFLKLYGRSGSKTGERNGGRGRRLRRRQQVLPFSSRQK